MAGHKEQVSKKDQEIHELKEQMSKIQQDFKSYNELLNEVFEKVEEKVLQMVERQKEDDERRHIIYARQRVTALPGWKKVYRRMMGRKTSK
jgi:hypothetical protein